VTGYTRKYALTLLKPPADEPPVSVKRTRRRSPTYGSAEVERLRRCWLVTDGICSKRLAPFLPELLDRLRRRQALRGFPIAVQARVAGMSPATVDRALKPLREQTKCTAWHQHHEGRDTAQTPDRYSHLCRLDGGTAWVLRDGPRCSLWLEWRRAVPVHAEHGRCGHRLGGLRWAARQTPGGEPIALTDRHDMLYGDTSARMAADVGQRGSSTCEERSDCCRRSALLRASRVRP
jgi:hypothetical protein